jgi:hypothetical protein
MSSTTYLINLEGQRLEGVIFDCVDRALKLNQKAEVSAPANSATIETFIDQKKVGEIYGISSVTVWDWEKKGILKSYRIGNLKRFKLSEVMGAPVPIKRMESQK